MKIYRVKPGNFGDDLNEIIVKKYVGKHFEGNVFLGDYKSELGFDDTLIIAIGTILNQNVPLGGKKIVVGAGTGYGIPPKLDKQWDIRFVRGPMTAKRLNINIKKFITDPAILLANQSFSQYICNENIGYIPHHAVANSEWEQLCNDMGLLYIDPRNSFDVVMENIMSCKLILTEAMHGAIVADTMRIPWIPICSAKKINAFKWHDWCQSMHINYTPICIPSLWSYNKVNHFKLAANSIKKKSIVHTLKRTIVKVNPKLSKNQVFTNKLNQVSDCYNDVFYL